MKVKIDGGLWIAIVLGFVAAKPPVSDDRVTNHGGLSRNRRDVTILDRLGCQPGDPQPLNRVNTTERLKKLRNLFYSARHNREVFDIKAYIIPTDDAHASEYVADHDKRRDFISGFTGSAGTAVVTLTEAALWTDGRYFLQADQQMDCNWLLMKQGQPGVPSIIEWLKTILSVGDLVGADPKLLNAETWLNYRAELDEVGIQLRSINTNLVDRVWGTEQPPYPSAPAFVHEIDFAGRSWQDKLGDIREQLVKNDADAIVVTALDEVAWTLNLRGADIPYNPLFRSFLVIDSTRAFLFTPTEKVTGSVLDHLNTRNCGSAVCVDVMEYETINSVLTGMAVAWEYVIIPRRYSYSGGASFSIYELIPETKVVLMPSPVIFLKAKKNPTEVEGMRRAHIKDAVALCDFLAKLEKEVQSSVTWDELKVVEVLDEFRSQQNESMGASFYTIAGFGANGAVIHYEPAPETNMNIDMNGLLLIDSGGQYLDGTTDVTRTLHYGKPTEWHKETYTRVLMGHIDLGLLTFPEGTTDKDVDIIARAPLYSAGLDYRHGTGHGIGAFLSVHEGPIQVRDEGEERSSLEENYYFSDEPGYYEDGNFGIRLENIVRVVKKNTTHQFGGINYYGFEPITLVPFEPSLILTELLSVRQKQWLNEYNSRIRLEVGDALKKQGRMDGFHWMMSKTNFITEDCKSSATTMLPLIPAIFSFLYFL